MRPSTTSRRLVLVLVLVLAIALTGCSDDAPSSSPDPSDRPAIASPSESTRPRHPRSRSVDAQRYEALADHVLDTPTEDEPWTFEDLEATVDFVARGRLGEHVDAGDVTITVHDVFPDVEPEQAWRNEPGSQWVLLDVELWRTVPVSDRDVVITDGGSAWGNETCCANDFVVPDGAQTAKHTGPHRHFRLFQFPEGRTPRYVVFATDEMAYAQEAALVELGDPDH